jgi:hypothetical protein
MTIRFLAVVLAVRLLVPGSLTAASPDKSGEGPRFELRDGEKYFRVNGQPTFVLGRNPTGKSPQAYDEHFRQAAAAGERFMRIHFTFNPPGEKAGQIDPAVLKSWDAALDYAEEHALAVMPVLGVWGEWNDGSQIKLWHRWDKNPFNAALGGPAKQPRELLEAGPCRDLWLQRLETFVKHWANRRAIVAWEIFSEVNLVTGATQERAVEFTERAAAVVRAADPWKRPITVSLAGFEEWPKLLKCDALDFNEVHPYADGKFGGHLDDLILSAVRRRLEKYGKPVLLGECGLDAGPPRGSSLEIAPRAEVGIRHAIWASVVSGAMNGRMLWWQDGYDLFENADLCRHYQQAGAAAVAFVHGIDFTDFAPVACDLSSGLKGAVIGNATTRLGWFRDAKCEPPDWPITPLPGQVVTLDAPGNSWQVEFFDPVTGKPLDKSLIAPEGHRLRITLREFQGSIAVQLKRLDP